jgi:hypothetical protein
MGLLCTRLGDHHQTRNFFDKNESWTRSGGYLFRPGFINELDESVYEKEQLQYNILWRRIQNTLKKRYSLSSNNLYNEEAYSQWKQYIRL